MTRPTTRFDLLCHESEEVRTFFEVEAVLTYLWGKDLTKMFLLVTRGAMCDIVYLRKLTANLDQVALAIRVASQPR